MKIASISICLTVLLLGSVVFAHEEAKDQALFTFGNEKVALSEFEYVYNKNNVNDEDSYSKESLDEYLELYINFRLKVKEAVSLGMDTVKSINAELETYRKQLAQNYLHDREVSDKVLKETYDRMKQEVRASHLLIQINDNELPSDTMEAYKKALNIRKRIIGGEDFVEMAKKYSADPSVKNNDGDIGYFSALQTVYPFETMAYNTKVGEVSMPVRTRFGYHLVKVTDKRPAQGKISVAHILVKIPENVTPAQEEKIAQKIKDIQTKLEAGEPFANVAEQMSEDKLSAKKAGILPAFGTGKMVQQFESAAFALKNDGDISEPIKTEFGWHIIKRISLETIPDYEEAKAELKKRIERDPRSEKAVDVLVNRIKKEYNFKSSEKNMQKLFDRIKDQLLNGRFVMEDKSNLDNFLFQLADQQYTQVDFINYLESKRNKKRSLSAYRVFIGYYNAYVQQICLDYEESQLEFKYPEFKALMGEYHDGILLFELTDTKVWSKAIKDTTGLKAFYEQQKNKYMWEQRAKVVIFNAKNEKIAKAAKKMIKKGSQTSEILEKLNTETAGSLTAKEGTYEKEQNDVVDNVAWEVGSSDNIDNGDGSVKFVWVQKIIEPTPKLLNEAKGFIVSDYQEYLEDLWIEELRKKYPVTVNQEVFNTLGK